MNTLTKHLRGLSDLFLEVGIVIVITYLWRFFIEGFEVTSKVVCLMRKLGFQISAAQLHNHTHFDAKKVVEIRWSLTISHM